MDGPITDSAREAMVRATLSRIEARTLRDALQAVADPRFPVSKPIANALAALRKHRDPIAVLGRAQYRAALPYAAAVLAEPCLAAVIEELGDDADDPTREQLLGAIDAVGSEYDDTVVAVMLASVADGDMAASDLCFTVLATDERFGATGWQEFERGEVTPTEPRTPTAASPEQREARRAKKARDAEDRRREAEAKAKAAGQVRAARKKERAAAAAGPTESGQPERSTPVAPSLGHRRALLTPIEEEEFDRDDPWATGVVLAWVRFDADDAGNPDHAGLEGKVRPCVVIAGSPTHLLVRPGYSEGGVKSRDWKCVPVRYWRQSGFDQPTWIDVVTVRVPRPESSPTGWLGPDDWNALW